MLEQMIDFVMSWLTNPSPIGIGLAIAFGRVVHAAGLVHDQQQVDQDAFGGGGLSAALIVQACKGPSAVHARVRC